MRNKTIIISPDRELCHLENYIYMDIRSNHLSHLSSSSHPWPSHACSWAPCTRPTASKLSSNRPNCTTEDAKSNDIFLLRSRLGV